MIQPGIVIVWAAAVCGQAAAPVLEPGLLAESPEALARAARLQGDPARGAIVFHRPYLGCVGCHAGADPIGPDLARLGPEATDRHLVDSILEPSKAIRDGYKTVTLATTDGRTVAGLLAEDRPDAIVLRDPARPEDRIIVRRADVEERSDQNPSIMPPGLVNGLADRQQFLDLLRYLREIADGGPARALELRPDPSDLEPPPLPEYEKDVDHAGLLAGLDAGSLRRGRVIYEGVCASCHGLKDRVGSMPTSLPFWSGTFKNGSDPHAMYKTLTLGFGQMPPQPWMVPRQKYDVIHYIRETFLKKSNPTQYARVDAPYLASLPKGSTEGPEPLDLEPWARMDYGPALMTTIEVGDVGSNIAYKGIAVRLDPGPGGVANGKHWMLYEHDTLRMAAAWSGPGFVDWRGISFNALHNAHPRITGHLRVANATGPGWADPDRGVFDDPRMLGRDDRPYGPLPRDWATYEGTYYHGGRVVLAYTVGEAGVLELPGLEADPSRPDHPSFSRTLEVSRSPDDLLLRIAPVGSAVALAGSGGGAELLERGGDILLKIAAEATPIRVKLLLSDGEPAALRALASASAPPESLRPLTEGGPRRWPEVLETRATVGRDDEPFAVDVLTHPETNPWNSRVRLTGFDFEPGSSRAYACDWDGDVWAIDGLDDPDGRLDWHRIASGLFQPLGLKIVDGLVYVGCRDQIARLEDKNGDGEVDFVAAFNSDHQVTEHFHEFAMGLQVDADRNFYYTKAARHAKTALVPHHGTLLKVAADGLSTEILARGFRAPNGVLLEPDGTFYLTDQEGHWTPKNRLNHVRVGGFYGNMLGYHDVSDPSDSAMEPPVIWITNAFDRSPAEPLRVEGPAWGALDGSLLSLSYGYGKIFVAMLETVDGQEQGGMVALPIPQSPTGLIRGRFRPADGHLYTCGMFAWAGSRTQPGGFYRVRATGKPAFTPIGLAARRTGVTITFSDPIDHASAADPSHYSARIWSIERSERYGSEHIDERRLEVAGARVSADGRSVTLAIPEIQPTRGMEIRYALRGPGGEPVEGKIHNTVHRLGD